MKAILYNDDDGQLCVIFPNYSDCANDIERDIVMQGVINRDLPKNPDGTNRPYCIKNYSELEDRRFVKPAWKLDVQNEKIYFDKIAASEIKKKQFRYLRKPLLEQLDIDFLKALESGDSNVISEIARKKQVLRDVTKIDMSTLDTPDKIHAFVPDILKN